MKKILVVDDEPLIVKGLKFALEQDGYEIFVAYNGEDAIKTFLENQIDLILLDVMLPGISGTEVCKKYAHSRLFL